MLWELQGEDFNLKESSVKKNWARTFYENNTQRVL